MTKKLRITYGVLAVLAAAICLCTVVYTDHLILSEFGYKYIDSVFRGNFPALFKEQSWSYGFTIYTIYAIWSIPVWIVFQLFHISGLVSEYALAVLWYKIMLAAFAAFSVYLLDRIAARVYKDEQHDAALQYICSPLFLLIVFYVAQCDIIGLSFVLLGVYYFLGEETKDYPKFLLAFALASTMKYFALIVFVPLVLLRQKRILLIARDWILGISLVFLSEIIKRFSDAAVHAEANPDFYVNQHVSSFSGYAIQLSENKNVGIFGIVFLALCARAYLWQRTEGLENAMRTFWIALGGYLCFLLGYPSNFYWYVLVVPFWVLLSFSNKEKLQINLILEIIFAVTTILNLAMKQRWVVAGSGMFDYLLLKSQRGVLAANEMPWTLRTRWEDIVEQGPLIAGLQYAAAIIFLVINFPRKKDGVYECSKEDRIELGILTVGKLAVVYGLLLGAFGVLWYVEG